MLMVIMVMVIIIIIIIIIKGTFQRITGYEFPDGE